MRHPPMTRVEATRAVVLRPLAEADLPEDSGPVPWLAELGLSDAGPALRMVRSHAPAPGGREHRFALASQASG